MAIWLTSDWHFNHQKEFIYQARGFETPEEMNEKLISLHNYYVRPDDDVYVLGDLILGGAEKLEDGIRYIERMNGNLHIVRGNHDSEKKWEAYNQLYPKIVELNNSIYLKYGKYNFYLSHFPSMTSNYDNDKPLKQRLINLCGHSHVKYPFQDMAYGAYHVEVDAHDNCPVLLDDIIKDLKVFYNEFH